MKKKYSLDYNIERDIDRLAAVNDILDTLDTIPNNTELEQMASYILYGKDENGLNAVQRKETTDSNKRYGTFNREADKQTRSLDAILDNPLTDQQSLKPIEERYIYLKKHSTIRKPKYDKKTGALLDPGDSDIPGMTELWDCIKRLEHVLAIGEGKVPPDEDTELITDPYKLYKLKHQIADMRLHQYYLKDAYKPTIKFLAVRPPQPQTYDWNTDSFYWMSYKEWYHRVNESWRTTLSRDITDYETRENLETHELEVKWIVRRHTFDWENPWHIRHLITYYSDIAMQLYENLYADGRALIKDFDRYQDMADLSPVRQYVLTRGIDKAPYPQIAAELQEIFGLKYNENRIGVILHKEIPEKIAAAVTKHRLLMDVPIRERKRCFRCGRYLPRHPLFFGSNRGRKDGLASNCKECERQRRIEKGGQGLHDRRSKDASMLEVPSNQA